MTIRVVTNYDYVEIRIYDAPLQKINLEDPAGMLYLYVGTILQTHYSTDKFMGFP